MRNYEKTCQDCAEYARLRNIPGTQHKKIICTHPFQCSVKLIPIEGILENCPLRKNINKK